MGQGFLARSLLSYLVILAISSFVAFPFCQGGEAVAEDISTGTLNIIVANRNGMVVGTDSRTTRGDGTFEDNEQKLFLIGNSIAITIAGFGSGQVGRHFTVSVSGIINNYIDELARNKYTPSYAEAVTTLPNIIRFGLTGIHIAARDLGILNSEPFTFIMMIAGKESNNFKVTRITLKPGERASEGMRYFQSSVVETKEFTTDKGTFVFATAGLDEVCNDVLKNPAKYLGFGGSFSRLITAETDAQRNNLGLDDIKSLTANLLLLTERATKYVGGPLQLAFFENGAFVPAASTQSFVKRRPTTPFSILRGSVFEGGAPKSGTLLFHLENIFLNANVDLTNNVFVGCTFSDDVLLLRSDDFFFGESNLVHNSDLALGINVNTADPNVQHLIRSFRWRRILVERPSPQQENPQPIQ